MNKEANLQHKNVNISILIIITCNNDRCISSYGYYIFRDIFSIDFPDVGEVDSLVSVEGASKDNFLAPYDNNLLSLEEQFGDKCCQPTFKVTSCIDDDRLKKENTLEPNLNCRIKKLPTSNKSFANKPICKIFNSIELLSLKEVKLKS